MLLASCIRFIAIIIIMIMISIIIIIIIMRVRNGLSHPFHTIY